MKQEYIYCLRCGRRLRSAEAKRVGMGKICLEKSKRETKTPLWLRSKNADSNTK